MKLGQFFDRLAGAKSPVPDKTTSEMSSEPKAQNRDKQRSEVFPFTKFVLVVVVIGASFLFGMAYQKAQDAKTTRILGTTGTTGSGSSSQGSNSSGGFGAFDGRGGGFGGASISTSQVTSINSSSITVKDSSGNSDTYAITGATVISDGGQQVSTTDIQSGDTVIVIPDRMDTSTARRIIVNPDFSNKSQPSQPNINPSETQIN